MVYSGMVQSGMDSNLYEQEQLDYHRYRDFMRQANMAIRNLELLSYSKAEATQLVFGAVERKLRTSKTTWVRK